MSETVVQIEREDPRSPRAQLALTEYALEVRAAARLELLDVAGAVADTDGFAGEGGAFWIALKCDDVVGCVGLRQWIDHAGEIKRMWVSPMLRGAGVGTSLLKALESEARTLGYVKLLLDTNAALIAARRFYAAHGYREIERYNENWDATHFFIKDLRRSWRDVDGTLDR